MSAGVSGTAWRPPGPGTLSGRTAVVTGANSGIGLEVTTALALAGAHVVMACRDPQRGQAAVQQVRAVVPAASVELVGLDLADLASVRSAAAAVSARHPRVDLLVNNAGVMATARRTTRDGFELQLGTNHLGHFALTGLLLPVLVAAGQSGADPTGGPGQRSRVVSVSSLVHHRGRLQRDDLMLEHGYRRWAAYAQSKLANLLFAFELQRRLDASGQPVDSLAAHPGLAATNLVASGPLAGIGALKAVTDRVGAWVVQSPRQGAQPVLRAATDLAVAGGDFVGPGSWGGTRGTPVLAPSAPAAMDEADAAWLWQESERLTGVLFP